MKLFKKLAAAALAAVLALSMVGCGAGGTGSALDLKNEVLNAIEDDYYTDNKTATHTTAMDAAAAKLIEKAVADEAAKNDDVTVKELLRNNGTVLQENGTGNCITIFMPYGQLSTELMQQAYIEEMKGTLESAIRYVANDEYYNRHDTMVKIGNPEISVDDSIEMGVATGKIKGRNYLVLLVQNARA